MRVGLVVPGFSASDDDWCIPALRHLARVMRRDDDVRVAALRYPYRAARYAVDGAEVVAVGGADRRGAGALATWRKTLDILRAEHRRRPFDILHAFWATESGLLAALAGRLLRIPTLVSLAGGELVSLPDIAYGDQRVAWERLKVRASLRLASGVSAGSRYLTIVATRHVPSSRLHRAPLGVDLELFSPGTPAAGAPRLVHAGTLTAVKDQSMLLRAFQRVRQQVPEAALELVGDGPLRPALERLAAELGVLPAVRFRGSVEHDELPAVYRAGVAFVVSSRHEAQSMVALEAAACGIPVVGTRVGVVPELADADGVVPVGAVEALANAIAVAFRGPPRTPTATQSRVRAEFGLEPCVDRFRALYAHLMAT